MSAGFTSITGIKFQNAAGEPLTSGRVTCWPVNNQSQPVSATLNLAAGGGIISVTPVTFLIVNGAITTDQVGNQPQLADTTLTNPPNIGYKVRVIDASNNVEIQGPGYDCVQPSGPTFSFDTYTPIQPTLTAVTSGPPGQSSYQAWLALGNVGNQAQFIASLQGPAGTDGATTPNFVAPITAPAATIAGGVSAVRVAAPKLVSPVLDNRSTVDDAAYKLRVIDVASSRTVLSVDAEGDSLGLNFPTDDVVDRLPSTTIGIQGGSVDPATGRSNFAWDAAGNLYMAGTINPPLTGSISIAPPCPPMVEESSPIIPAALNVDLNHVIYDGQSVSSAQDAVPVTTIQPGSNLMFSANGPNAITLGASGVTLIPLVENYGSGSQGMRETGQNGFADHVWADLQQQGLVHKLLMSGCGLQGEVYEELCGPTDWNSSNQYYTAGTTASPSFLEMMSQIALGKSLAPSTYRHRAGFMIHGEFDGQSGNANYGVNMQTWQADIQAGSQAITGSKCPVPLFWSQCVVNFSGLQQLATCMSYPALHKMVGPEYFLQHFTAAQIAAGIAVNELHLTGYAQRLLGEYFWKAYKTEVLQGRRWLPLVPTGIQLLGKNVVLTYHLNPNASGLALDTSVVSDPGNFGFNFYLIQGSNAPLIESVTVTGNNQVTLALSDAPTPGANTLSYAVNVTNQGISTNWGPLAGDRGCLRNNDPTLSYYPDANGNLTPLYDYAVAFKVTV